MISKQDDWSVIHFRPQQFIVFSQPLLSFKLFDLDHVFTILKYNGNQRLLHHHFSAFIPAVFVETNYDNSKTIELKNKKAR